MKYANCGERHIVNGKGCFTYKNPVEKAHKKKKKITTIITEQHNSNKLVTKGVFYYRCKFSDKKMYHHFQIKMYNSL